MTGARAIATESTRPPFAAFSNRFLKRTVVATLITLGLVAMTATVYGHPRWSGYYLAAGMWSLVFLGLTPLILKALLFDRRRLLGMGLILVKFVWIGLMFALFMHWRRGGEEPKVLGSALIAGVTTPLIVIVLRALGGALETRSETLKSDKEEMP